MDAQDVARLFRDKGTDILREMFRGNLGGLSRDVEKSLQGYR